MPQALLPRSLLLLACVSLPEHFRDPHGAGTLGMISKAWALVSHSVNACWRGQCPGCLQPASHVAPRAKARGRRALRGEEVPPK